jgi:hypothetical protein
MPSLSNHQSRSFTKVLLIGDSKAGKTGALTSLVAVGYKLRILDFDNGLDVLKQYVMRDCPDKVDNVTFKTLRDPRKASPAGPVLDGAPTAFITGIKLLDRWKDGETDLGVPASWGPDCILVIDSFTFMSDAAFDFRESISSRAGPGKYDRRAVYKDAQDAMENVLGLLTGESFKTNVIVIAHVKYMEQEAGVLKGYPTSVGSALSPHIPTYFNNYFRFVTKGGKRKIETVTTPLFDLANAKPFGMPDSFDVGDGLAKIFEILRK